MDEQVVPTFEVPVPVRGAAVGGGLKRSATVPTSLTALVPDAPSATTAARNLFSPAPEFAGKLRWETPLRSGRHPESWQGARELGCQNAVRTRNAARVGAVIRATVADVVVAYVGPALPRPTVQKWLCLLCEYLELNADEQVLVVCLLRRYVRRGGKFVGKGDWARPQRWECVVAVACYLAVLLTEEFPGRTAMDLRELLGPNFRFGSEQVTFLKVVDWRISVDEDDFNEVKDAVEGVIVGDEDAKEKMTGWFLVEQAVLDRKRAAAEEAAAAAAAAAAAMAAQSPVPTLGKKRGFAAIAPADDSVVPRVVVPRMEPVHAIPTATYIQSVPAVPHWAPHW